MLFPDRDRDAIAYSMLQKTVQSGSRRPSTRDSLDGALGVHQVRDSADWLMGSLPS